MGCLEGLTKATSTMAAVSFQPALAHLAKCWPDGDCGKRYTSDMMRLKLGVKTLALKYSNEDKAAASPKELLKTVRGKIWPDRATEQCEFEEEPPDDSDAEPATKSLRAA